MALDAASTSENVIDPSSSMSAVRSGWRAAPAAQPAAGVTPQRRTARPIPNARSGRVGQMAPVPASTRSVPNCDVRPMSSTLSPVAADAPPANNRAGECKPWTPLDNDADKAAEKAAERAGDRLGDIAVSVDVVLLTLRAGRLAVLLVAGRDPRDPLSWALPGGRISVTESLVSAARRALSEQAGVEGVSVHLEQLRTYGDPGRDSRGRVVSVGYLVLLPDLPRPEAWPG